MLFGHFSLHFSSEKSISFSLTRDAFTHLLVSYAAFPFLPLPRGKQIRLPLLLRRIRFLPPKKKNRPHPFFRIWPLYKTGARLLLSSFPIRSQLPPVLSGQIIFHHLQRIFFQPRHLCLGDADKLRHLHLCLSFKKAQGYNFKFPVIQLFHRLT